MTPPKLPKPRSATDAEDDRAWRRCLDFAGRHLGRDFGALEDDDVALTRMCAALRSINNIVDDEIDRSSAPGERCLIHVEALEVLAFAIEAIVSRDQVGRALLHFGRLYRAVAAFDEFSNATSEPFIHPTPDADALDAIDPGAGAEGESP